MLSMAVLDESKGSRSSVLHEGTELSLYDEEAHERLLEEEDFWRRAESLQADDEPWEELRDRHVENGDYDQIGFSHPDRATYGGIGHLSACDPTGTSLVSKEAEMMEEEEEEEEEERGPRLHSLSRGRGSLCARPGCRPHRLGKGIRSRPPARRRGQRRRAPRQAKPRAGRPRGAAGALLAREINLLPAGWTRTARPAPLPGLRSSAGPLARSPPKHRPSLTQHFARRPVDGRLGHATLGHWSPGPIQGGGPDPPLGWDGESRRLHGVSCTCLVAPGGLAAQGLAG